MAKALKVAAVVTAVAALTIVTGGAAAGFGVALSTTLAGTGISAGALLASSALLSTGASLLTKTPEVPKAQVERLNASVDPRAFRKTALGSTALGTDIRYVEWFGTDQERCGWIMAHASHAIAGVDEIWLDDELAWSGGVTRGKFAGYFWVRQTRNEGTAANAFTFGSGRWNGTRRLTGCAYSLLEFKVTGNSKKTESPFANGIPTRVTVIGRGGPLYDPRRDSTVPGGSGPMRADDQSTWRYVTNDGATIGENLALQILRVLLGSRINGKLATGCGLPVRRIDLPSFIVAANQCDELVNRSAGGTEPRYRGAGVISEGDDRRGTLDALCAACCGRFRDAGGKLSLAIMHNDLAAVATDPGLTDDDIVGPFVWDPDSSVEATPNVARGRYTDPSPASLYQLVDYPEVSLTSFDGIDRVLPLDLAWVESPSQAQRVVKQALQRKQYQGRRFAAPFDIVAWRYNVGDLVPLTLAALGWNRKIFRVVETDPGANPVQMLLEEENAAIYAWDADDRAPVQAAAAAVYDRANSPVLRAIADIDTAVTTILSDDVITRGREKRELMRQWQALDAQYQALNARFAALGSPADVQASQSDASSARQQLLTLLISLTPAWDNVDVDTPVDGATLNARWQTARSALETFAAAITGRPGRDGRGGYTAVLDNENHILPADEAGNILTYDGAGSAFQVLYGTTEVTGSFSLAFVANPQNLTASTSGMSFTVTGGLDAGEPAGYLTVRATGSGEHAGVVIEKVFSLTKSRAGADGTSPPLIRLVASSQLLRLDKDGQIAAGHPPFVFRVDKRNTSAPINWFISPGHQVDGIPGHSTIVDGVLTVSPTRMRDIIQNNGANGLGFSTLVRATCGDLVDEVTVTKVQDGAKGETGVGLPGEPGKDGTTYYPYVAYANSADGTVDFTTGEPNVGGILRAYVGHGSGTAAAEPTSPFYYSWARYSGPSFGMHSRGTAVLAGNSVVKQGGGEAWDSDAYSTSGYKNGAFASFTGQGDSADYFMAGLNTDPTANASFSSIDYAWYLYPGGPGQAPVAQIYENGNPEGSVYIGGYGAGTFRVEYDGRYVRYIYNGDVYRTVDIGPGYTFYFDSSIARPGRAIRNIDFGAFPARPSSGVTLVADTPATEVSGSSIRASVSAGWGTGHAHSLETFARGAAASWTIPPSAGQARNTMGGLTQGDGFSRGNSYDSITFALHVNDAGATGIYVNGGAFRPGPTVDLAQPTYCRVHYDGARWVRFYINDSELPAYDWGPSTEPLRFAAALASVNPRIEDVVFTAAGTKGDRGDNAPLVITQWSADNASWHANYQAGDLFFRQSNNGGATFDPGIRAIGEGGINGEYSAQAFLRSTTIPGTPPNNTGNPPTGWSDGPPSGTDYLWLTTARFRNGGQISNWSAPQRISGEKGADGVNPPTVTVSASPTAISYDKTGAITSGPVTFTAVRQNAVGPIAWADRTGAHAVYGRGDTTFSGDTITLTAARVAEILAYNAVNQGKASFELTASVGAGQGSATITKVKDGIDGEPGPPGTPGTGVGGVSVVGRCHETLSLYCGGRTVTISANKVVRLYRGPEGAQYPQVMAQRSSDGAFFVAGQGFYQGTFNQASEMSFTISWVPPTPDTYLFSLDDFLVGTTPSSDIFTAST